MWNSHRHDRSRLLARLFNLSWANVIAGALWNTIYLIGMRFNSTNFVMSHERSLRCVWQLRFGFYRRHVFSKKIRSHRIISCAKVKVENCLYVHDFSIGKKFNQLSQSKARNSRLARRLEVVFFCYTENENLRHMINSFEWLFLFTRSTNTKTWFAFSAECAQSCSFSVAGNAFVQFENDSHSHTRARAAVKFIIWPEAKANPKFIILSECISHLRSGACLACVRVTVT